MLREMRLSQSPHPSATGTARTVLPRLLVNGNQLSWNLAHMLRVLAVLALCVCMNAQYVHRRGIDSGPPPVPRQDVIVTFKGVLKQMKKKQILIQGEDNQLFTIRRNK